MARAWFGGDLGIGRGIAANVAIAAPISALLFVLTRKPYRRAMEART